MPPRHPAAAALRGTAGALLASWLSARLWLWTLRALPFLNSLPIFLLFLAGPAACLGYCLLRGWRCWRFAQWAVLLSAFAGACLAVLLDSRAPTALAPPAGLAAVCFAVRARSALLRYADPAWFADPRRVACVRAGGSLYNLWPSGPFAPAWSTSFQVGEHGTLIHISGSTIRVAPPIRKGKTFSVHDVAGVVVGPSYGSCVLYDRALRTLAKYGTARKNASLLTQYLMAHGIPFSRYEEALPVPPPPEEPAPAFRSPPAPDVPEEPAAGPSTQAPPAASLPNWFSLPLCRPAPERSALLLAAGCLLAFTAFAVIPVLVGLCAPPAWTGFLMTYVWSGVPLLCLLGPAVGLTLSGQLLPEELEVDHGRVLRCSFFGKHTDLTEKISGFRQDPSGLCWVLLDQRQKPLARFRGDAPAASLLLKHLRLHNIPWVRTSAPGKDLIK